MPTAHNKCLHKNVYSPGQWYSFFFVPPKSPEMSLYYKTVETELSRLYFSFLPKDQIHGKILDFLDVPNVGGKIHKSKLRKIFISETSSARGRKLFARRKNHVKEVKLFPLKSDKPYEGPFKFFKSKNSRKWSEVATRLRGPVSAQKRGFTKPHVSSLLNEETSRSDESDAQYIPSSSKVKVRSFGGSSKLVTKKPVKPYEGPFKLFKSKNSKVSVESVEHDVQATGSRCDSARETDAKDHTTAPSVQEISDSSDDSDIQYIPHRSKIKETASKRSEEVRKQPNYKANSRFQMKKVGNSQRKPSPKWYENPLSSDSSKSYSVESDEELAVKSISYKNENKCSGADKNNLVEITGTGNPKPISEQLGHDSKATPSSAWNAKPHIYKQKTYNILSSLDDSEDNLTIVTKPVVESRSAAVKPSAKSEPPSACGQQDLNQIIIPIGSEGTVLDKYHSGLSEIPNDHALGTNPADCPPPHGDVPNKFEASGINQSRKSVDFKNVEYYYYNRDTSSSLTQQSSSSHQSKANQLKNDSSSDDNDYDTGVVSPIAMSQESQLQSQDVMNRNASSDFRPSDIKPSKWIFEKVRPQFPSVPPTQASPGDSGLVEEYPRCSSPPDLKSSLCPQNVQKLKYSPVSSQHLSSASPLPSSDICVLPSDLDVIRRIGALKSVEEENLSQISAATEIISARITVDLKEPGALEAIQQHCRNILGAVTSQNVLSTATSLVEPRSMLTPTCQKEGTQLVEDPIRSTEETSCIEGTTIPAGEQNKTPLILESSQYDSHIELSEIFSLKKPFSQSVMDEYHTPRTEMTSQRSEIMSDAESINSNISHPNDGSQTMTTPSQRQKLPFKKRWPVLSAPKLNIITFNNVPTVQSASVEKSAPVSPECFLATSAKTSSTCSVISDAKHSSITSFTKTAADRDKRSSVSGSVNVVNPNILPAEISKPCSPSAVETTRTKNTAFPAGLHRSSVACLEMKQSMNRTAAANFEDKTDAVKASRSVDPPNDDRYSVANVKIKGPMTMPDLTRVKSSSIPSVESGIIQPTAANGKMCSHSTAETSRSSKAGASSIKCTSAASYKTDSLINSAAATNRSSSARTKAASDGPQDTHSLAAVKSNVVSDLDSEQLPQHNVNVEFQLNRSCGSHSSKASLKEWQRQANLVWKMTLPHISQQFFNDPETRNVRAVCDEISSRSGLTLSEPSMRLRAQAAVDLQPKNVELLRRDVTEVVPETKRDTSDMPTPNPALPPFMRDFLFNSPSNPSKSLYYNYVDPDAETQLRCSNKSDLDSGPLEREDSSSNDSMQVVLPKSQVLRDIGPTPPTDDDSYLPRNDTPAERRSTGRRSGVPDDTRSDVQRRTSTVQTHLMSKPRTSESQLGEHDFFLSFL